MTNDLMLDLQFAAPILIMATMSIILIVVDALTGKNKTINYVLSIVSMVAAFVASGILIAGNNFADVVVMKELPISMGMLSYSGFAYLFDLMFLAAGILNVIAAREFNVRADAEYKEFYSLIMLAVTGMMMISHANDFLLLFIGIELMSILFYVLAGYFRERISSIEAALKYFLLGAFASGFLLYGISMIYGASGSLYFADIQNALTIGEFNRLYMVLGLALITIGLSFKIAAFPFHQWAPDVYTGAPTVVTAFMSTAGKAAAVFAFVIIGKNLMQNQLQSVIDTSYIGNIQFVIAILAAATMLIGNITAIAQNNVKRMLAYSSVAHAGYMLIGVASNSIDGWSGAAFYSAAYIFMQIGAFLVVANLEGKDGDMLNFEHYSGLHKSRPILAAMMAIFMFSLAGIPPFAGFFGKYYIFKAAIDSGFTWLAIVAVISSVISVYFYLRLIVTMYFKEPLSEISEEEPKAAGFSLIVCTLVLLVLGLFPNVVIDWARMFV